MASKYEPYDKFGNLVNLETLLPDVPFRAIILMDKNHPYPEKLNKKGEITEPKRNKKKESFFGHE